jgi:proline dehydrogenase
MKQKIIKEMLFSVFKNNNILLKKYVNNNTVDYINKYFINQQRQSIIDFYETQNNIT